MSGNYAKSFARKGAFLLISSLGYVVGAPPSLAGQDANFILYNHHMEEKGAVELEVYSDYSHVGKGEPNYTAQMFEIEYGVTELWTAAVYLEAAKTYEPGGSYDFASFRIENRLRLFKDETLLNPVLYAEYEQKWPESKFMRSVVGRTDSEESEEGEGGEHEEGIEHEIETKLILGHDFSSRLNVAVNTIQEVNLDNGVWAFGYVAGLNYDLFRSFDAAAQSEFDGANGGWGINKLTLGIEFFGGLGDSVKGLTLDSDKTEQYAGVGLRADFNNEFHIGVGGAFGLTGASEDALVRFTAGYEFE